MCRTLILALGVLSTFGVKTDYSQLNNQQLLDTAMESVYLNHSEDSITLHCWWIGTTAGRLSECEPTIYTDTAIWDKTDFRDKYFELYDELENDETGEFRQEMINNILMNKIMDDLTNNLMKNK